MYPKIVINMTKLRENLDFLCKVAHDKNVSVAVVTKVFCADKRIVDLINSSEADFLADSRVYNLSNYPERRKPSILLRISSPYEAANVVYFADISLQSEIETIKKIGESAAQLRKQHKVVLMIDLGDLREGIFFENEQEIYKACEAVLAQESLELYGIGTNLTCYGGVLPDSNNLGNLVDIAKRIREKYSVELPFVSGGNSSSLGLLMNGGVPDGITNLRLGESFVLGRDTAECCYIDGMHGDAVTLEADIVELKRKPSKPIGTIGRNAFGEEVYFEDKGEMLRGILAIGRQDVDETGLYCMQDNIEIIGASSDHLLVDLTHADVYNIGDTLRFRMDYGAVLKAFTSAYTSREYID